MKVRCYVDGQRNRAQEYKDEAPSNAAKLYVEEWHDDSIDEIDVVVEPVDDYARTMLAWTMRPDGVRARLFRVTPIVTHKVEEVQTFDREQS